MVGGVCTHIFLVTGWFLGGTGRLELELKVDPLVDDGGAMNRADRTPPPTTTSRPSSRQPCAPGFDFTAPLFAAFSPQQLRRTLTAGSAICPPVGPPHTLSSMILGRSHVEPSLKVAPQGDSQATHGPETTLS